MSSNGIDSGNTLDTAVTSNFNNNVRGNSDEREIIIMQNDNDHFYQKA
jgi:hypothetical protein